MTNAPKAPEAPTSPEAPVAPEAPSATQAAEAVNEAVTEANQAEAKPAPKKKVVKKAVTKSKPGKKATNKEIMVRPVKAFKIHCPTQSVTIFPDTVTQVKDDDWIRHQINSNVLKQM